MALAGVVKTSAQANALCKRMRYFAARDGQLFRRQKGDCSEDFAWRKILKGERPLLSIEITRECPLRCPGCYAYDDAHLGGAMTLRGLRDRKGQELIDGVLEVVDRLKPLHLSLIGGDPLVRYRDNWESLSPGLFEVGDGQQDRPWWCLYCMRSEQRRLHIAYVRNVRALDLLRY